VCHPVERAGCIMSCDDLSRSHWWRTAPLLLACALMDLCREWLAETAGCGSLQNTFVGTQAREVTNQQVIWECHHCVPPASACQVLGVPAVETDRGLPSSCDPAGDTVSNMDLRPALAAHKERVERDKDSIMTLVRRNQHQYNTNMTPV
jgi:hypothetical protein